MHCSWCIRLKSSRHKLFASAPVEGGLGEFVEKGEPFSEVLRTVTLGS